MTESDATGRRRAPRLPLGPRGKKVARTAGLAGAVLGFAAAGVAAGVALERYVVGRNRDVDDPYRHEPFGQLPADRTLNVPVDGDVDLHVEVVEPAGGAAAELTVVFVHGFCLDMGTFHFQRRDLGGLVDPAIRMVFYDQPGHGRSDRLSAGDYSLEALGQGVRRVIEEVTPSGPLVLIGHSMGGMTIMALAEDDPELFRERVVGVSFMSTSAGGLDEVTFGLPDMVARIRRPLIPVLTGVNRLTPTMIDRARRVSSDLAWLLTRRYGFGGEFPSPALVSYVEEMNSHTSAEVILAYLRTLFEHIRHDALEALEGIETLVVTGDKDLLIPVEHSEEICRVLPNAELVVIEDAGHVALMECHEQVNAHLAEFLSRASRAAAGAEPQPRAARLWSSLARAGKLRRAARRRTRRTGPGEPLAQ
ncbi:MAG: alpha/beta fold hydrolase [Micromonosporaceae bacterium]|nr:alpha/beta fold hydrolase [Micromonosporaceae bacterium]